MASDKNVVSVEAHKLAAKGQFDKAIAEWKKLIKETPNDANIFNTIGDLCLKKNSKAEAVDAYQRAADILAGEGFTSKAIALYKKVLNINPAKIEAHLALGALNAEKGLVTNALASYKTAADYYTRSRETVKALAVYQKMADLNTSNVAFRIKLAEMYAKEGMKSEAARAYLDAADVYLSRDAFTEARQVFEKILAVDPNNKQVYHKAGIVYLREGKFVEAGRALRPAFENDPTNQDLASSYFDALARAGMYDEAEEALRKFLEEHPENLDLRERLFQICLSRKDFIKALVEASAIADARVASGQADNALAVLTDLVNAAPGFAHGLRRLAELHASLNRPDDAARELLRAADVLMAEGDRERAEAVLGRALELVPDLPGALERLEDLEAPATIVPPETLPSTPGPESAAEPELTVPAANEETAKEPPAAAPETEAFTSPEPVPSPPELEPAAEPELAVPGHEEAASEPPAAAPETEAFTSPEPVPSPPEPELTVPEREEATVESPVPPEGLIEPEQADSALTAAFLEADVLVKYGLPENASRYLEALAEKTPDNPLIYLKLRDLYHERGNTLDAVRCALRAADLYAAAGARDRADVIFATTEMMAPDHPEILARLGKAVEGSVQAAPPPTESGVAPEVPAAQPLPLEEPSPGEPAHEGVAFPEEEQPFVTAVEPPAAHPEAEPEPAGPAPELPPETDTSDVGSEAGEVGLREQAPATSSELPAELGEEEARVPPSPELLPEMDIDDMARPSDDEAVRALMEEIRTLGKENGQAPREHEASSLPESPVTEADEPRKSAAKGPSDEDFFDLGAELLKESEASGRQQGAGADKFFDLAAELQDELNAVTLSDLTPAAVEEQSLDDIFEEFKRGIEQEALKAKQEADTHYNIGVAYKETSLLDDAIAEFLMTGEDEPKFVQSRHMLGLCYLEKGDYDIAVNEIQNALDNAERLGTDIADRIAMRYDLGLALQGTGSVERALQEFRNVLKADPGYRDAAVRVNELEKGEFFSLDQIKNDIVREISSKFLAEEERIEQEEKNKWNKK